MTIQFNELPIETPLRKKPGPSKEKIRAKVKVKIVDYDENSFLVGLQRGLRYVKKLSIQKHQDGKAVSDKEIEKEIKDMIAKGDFDQAIFDDYDRLVEGKPVKRRGRKPKETTEKPSSKTKGKAKK